MPKNLSSRFSKSVIESAHTALCLHETKPLPQCVMEATNGLFCDADPTAAYGVFPYAAFQASFAFQRLKAFPYVHPMQRMSLLLSYGVQSEELLIAIEARLFALQKVCHLMLTEHGLENTEENLRFVLRKFAEEHPALGHRLLQELSLYDEPQHTETALESEPAALFREQGQFIRSMKDYLDGSQSVSRWRYYKKHDEYRTEHHRISLLQAAKVANDLLPVILASRKQLAEKLAEKAVNSIRDELVVARVKEGGVVSPSQLCLFRAEFSAENTALLVNDDLTVEYVVHCVAAATEAVEEVMASNNAVHLALGSKASIKYASRSAAEVAKKAIVLAEQAKTLSAFGQVGRDDELEELALTSGKAMAIAIKAAFYAAKAGLVNHPKLEKLLILAVKRSMLEALENAVIPAVAQQTRSEYLEQLANAVGLAVGTEMQNRIGVAGLSIAQKHSEAQLAAQETPRGKAVVAGDQAVTTFVYASTGAAQKYVVNPTGILVELRAAFNPQMMGKRAIEVYDIGDQGPETAMVKVAAIAATTVIAYDYSTVGGLGKKGFADQLAAIKKGITPLSRANPTFQAQLQALEADVQAIIGVLPPAVAAPPWQTIRPQIKVLWSRKHNIAKGNLLALEQALTAAAPAPAELTDLCNSLEKILSQIPTNETAPAANIGQTIHQLATGQTAPVVPFVYGAEALLPVMTSAAMRGADEAHKAAPVLLDARFYASRPSLGSAKDQLRYGPLYAQLKVLHEELGALELAERYPGDVEAGVAPINFDKFIEEFKKLAYLLTLTPSLIDSTLMSEFLPRITQRFAAIFERKLARDKENQVPTERLTTHSYELVAILSNLRAVYGIDLTVDQRVSAGRDVYHLLERQTTGGKVAQFLKHWGTLISQIAGVVLAGVGLFEVFGIIETLFTDYAPDYFLSNLIGFASIAAVGLSMFAVSNIAMVIIVTKLREIIERLDNEKHPLWAREKEEAILTLKAMLKKIVDSHSSKDTGLQINPDDIDLLNELDLNDPPMQEVRQDRKKEILRELSALVAKIVQGATFQQAAHAVIGQTPQQQMRALHYELAAQIKQYIQVHVGAAALAPDLHRYLIKFAERIRAFTPEHEAAAQAAVPSAAAQAAAQAADQAADQQAVQATQADITTRQTLQAAGAGVVSVNAALALADAAEQLRAARAAKVAAQAQLQAVGTDPLASQVQAVATRVVTDLAAPRAPLVRFSDLAHYEEVAKSYIAQQRKLGGAASANMTHNVAKTILTVTKRVLEAKPDVDSIVMRVAIATANDAAIAIECLTPPNSPNSAIKRVEAALLKAVAEVVYRMTDAAVVYRKNAADLQTALGQASPQATVTYIETTMLPLFNAHRTADHSVEESMFEAVSVAVLNGLTPGTIDDSDHEPILDEVKKVTSRYDNAVEGLIREAALAAAKANLYDGAEAIALQTNGGQLAPAGHAIVNPLHAARDGAAKAYLKALEAGGTLGAAEKAARAAGAEATKSAIALETPVRIVQKAEAAGFASAGPAKLTEQEAFVRRLQIAEREAKAAAAVQHRLAALTKAAQPAQPGFLQRIRQRVAGGAAFIAVGAQPPQQVSIALRSEERPFDVSRSGERVVRPYF